MQSFAAIKSECLAGCECVVLSSIWSLIGSRGDELPPEPLLRWLCRVFNAFAVAGIFLSTFFFFFFFFNFLPPNLIYHWECLFHLLSVHPRAISCSNRRLSFSIRISPFFLMLFKLSCWSSRLSSRIKLDVRPWGRWSCPLGSILGLIAIPDPEGLIFYPWFAEALLC